MKVLAIIVVAFAASIIKLAIDSLMFKKLKNYVITSNEQINPYTTLMFCIGLIAGMLATLLSMH